MGGGTTGLDESLLYTADIEYGWGDACDKKAMHGCPRIKKASVMKTFTCPTILGFKMETKEPVSKNAITGITMAYQSVRESLSSESESESSSDEKSE
ncbi:hypothetical protein Tco_0513244 [Tanacetum coccineum]